MFAGIGTVDSFYPRIVVWVVLLARWSGRGDARIFLILRTDVDRSLPDLGGQETGSPDNPTDRGPRDQAERRRPWGGSGADLVGGVGTLRLCVLLSAGAIKRSEWDKVEQGGGERRRSAGVLDSSFPEPGGWCFV